MSKVQEYYGTKRIKAWREDKHEKEGYAVLYSDGYMSWSPKDVFEAAYQPITQMTFNHALVAMKEGHAISRKSWRARNPLIWVKYDKEANSFVSNYHVCDLHSLKEKQNSDKVFRCEFDTEDLLADDWYIVE